jgi:hypothetical protein
MGGGSLRVLRLLIFSTNSIVIPMGTKPLISLSGILMMMIQTLLTGFHLYTTKEFEIKEKHETASSVSFLSSCITLYI